MKTKRLSLAALLVGLTACVPVVVGTSADTGRSPATSSPAPASQTTTTSPRAAQAGTGSFRAGAAIRSITPPSGQGIGLRGYGGRTSPFKGIRSQLYTRVIALDDGNSKALMLSIELLSVKGPIYNNLTRMITERTGIPKERILMSATHTHSGPGSEARVQGKFESEAQRKALRAYYEKFANQTLQAVDEALANLQPARMGLGTGSSNVNVNRVVKRPNGTYWLGANPKGPSDKTVWVLRFDDAKGKPIAILSNFAVHGTVMGNGNYYITGDLPGATSLFVEKHYGGGLVSPWTSGAAGDQSPIHYHQSRFIPGKTPTDLGKRLGQEVVRVADQIQTTSNVKIQAAIKEIRLPGKRGRGGVPLRISLFSLNEDILICGLAAEVYSAIGERIRSEAPVPNAGIFTQTNGNTAGYIPTREGFSQPGYEVKAAKAGPDAERVILSAFKDFYKKLN